MPIFIIIYDVEYYVADMYSFDMRVGHLRGVTVDVSTIIMTIIPGDHDQAISRTSARLHDRPSQKLSSRPLASTWKSTSFLRDAEIQRTTNLSIINRARHHAKLCPLCQRLPCTCSWPVS